MSRINLKTPISYYGGKQKLATKIISVLPDHTLYCEPFLGGAAVFFEHQVVNTPICVSVALQLPMYAECHVVMLDGFQRSALIKIPPQSLLIITALLLLLDPR